jgi:hypothetical protein
MQIIRNMLIFAKFLRKQKISRKFSRKRKNLTKFDSDRMYGACGVIFVYIKLHFRRIKKHICSDVIIQLPLGLKRNVRFCLFAKISLRKLTKIAETICGMGHKIDKCLLN